MNMDSDGTTSMEIPTQPQVATSNFVNQQLVVTDTTPSHPRDQFREISVKVHIRRPDKDNWAYLGRGIVSQETVGRSNRIVVRSISSHKILTTFGEGSPLQAEKRGNFVVVACVEGSRVVSWSLNTLNNSETLRLLAIIELSCYSCKAALSDAGIQASYRRRIVRAIKDDRRKRHKRRKDQDAMVAAFAKTGIDDQTPQPHHNPAVPSIQQ
ncbi:hypothetical protein C8Q75DRAFT_235891 [Abortiporus biennis]|nr:hypothetical protein C8Q75DRAFT_235891 [Abortiporus biennis]